MTNKHKGETTLEIDGKTYTMRLGFDALSTLEERLDMGVQQIFESLNTRPRLSTMRAIFHACLSEHHPEVKESDVGALIELAGLPALMAKFTEATQNTFPAPEPAGAAGGEPIPLGRPAGGIGTG